LSSKVLRGCGSALVRPYSLINVAPEIRDDPACAEGSDKIDAKEGERLAELERLAYSRGFEAGLEKGCREAGSLIKTASLLVEKLEHLRREVMERSEREMLELSLAVAKKVIRSEIATNRESVVQIIKAAIRKLTIKDSIKIRLNPEDAAYLSGRKPELLDISGGSKEMTIQEDPSVPRGGCVIEAGMAEVDARLGQQMEEVVRGLTIGIKDEEGGVPGRHE
jgi:flagellar assembly protein FliH